LEVVTRIVFVLEFSLAKAKPVKPKSNKKIKINFLIAFLNNHATPHEINE
jgi:hypothetical protein